MVFEVLGWVGAVVILAGYGLFSLGRLANGPLYQWANLIGALCISVNVASHGAYPSAIVNAIWAVIAVVVLVGMSRRRRAARRAEEARAVAPSPSPPSRPRPRPLRSRPSPSPSPSSPPRWPS
nr:hypothetical protein GCM10025699_67440 [Microbacterium flavescens]